MAKYKVGDKVRIVSERPASPRFVDPMVQYLGKTLTVSKVEEETLGTIYRFQEATSEVFHEKRYYWAFKEDWIAGLAEPQVKRHDNDLSVVIRFCGNKTTARLMRGETIVKTATARRNPADNYSRAEGARVAVERLFEKKRNEGKPKESKPKIGDKFVVVGRSADMRHKFDIGTIVTLILLQDDGYSRYSDKNGLMQFVADRDVKPYKENTK